jgi:hypothetical protein
MAYIDKLTPMRRMAFWMFSAFSCALIIQALESPHRIPLWQFCMVVFCLCGCLVAMDRFIGRSTPTRKAVFIALIFVLFKFYGDLAPVWYEPSEHPFGETFLSAAIKAGIIGVVLISFNLAFQRSPGD